MIQYAIKKEFTSSSNVMKTKQNQFRNDISDKYLTFIVKVTTKT